MAIRIRKASDKADRPENRAPEGLHDKMPICCVALLGIVVRPRSAEQGPRKAGMRPRSGMLAPQLQSAAAGHPLRCPIPLRGSLGQRCGAPLRPSSRASHLSIFRANATHGGLIQRFLSA